MRRIGLFDAILKACFLAPLVLAVGCIPSGRKGALPKVEDSVFFGVNYYAPFAESHDLLRRKGLDVRRVIREDISQFRRLGLNGLRVHCYDIEMSDGDGKLLDNEHLDLFDYLVAACASNGIRTVVTLMCAWNTPESNRGEAKGFASRFPRAQLTSNPAAIAAQVRFAESLVAHVNPYTGARYADDPAIVAFELFNEPAYKSGLPDAAVTDYVKGLAAAVRRTGTVKPIYYNSWHKREKAVAAAGIDGVTGAAYPTGLDSGSTRIGNRLSEVRRSYLRDVPEQRDLRKLIYEFDAADCSGAYMYPAMAKEFRAEGADLAFQFHYLATPLADRNRVVRTHYLNLFHTPAKALSLAIAAEVFRRTPKGEPYEPGYDTMSFGPFRIVPDRNLSEMLTETDFLYTADTEAAVSDPGKLTRIWGCGRSSVVSSSGNGAYFLDRADAGVWRLQLAPSVLPVADPYSGEDTVKTVIRPDPIELRVTVPDLGPAFTVWSDRDRIVCATNGTVGLPAGDYVLTRGRSFDRGVEAVLSRLVPQPFVVPRATATGRECPLQVRHAPCAANGWNFFDPQQCVGARIATAKIGLTDDGRGGAAVRMTLSSLVGRTDFAKLSSGCEGAAFAAAHPEVGTDADIVVRIRATVPDTAQVEMVVAQSDGFAFTTVVPVTTNWQDIVLAPSDFRWYRHYNGRQPPVGTTVDLRKAVNMHFGIGRFLCSKTADRPHGIEIASVILKESLKKGKHK